MQAIRRRRSIRTQLRATIISLAVIPLMLMGAVMSGQSIQTQQQQALDTQRQVARRVSAEVYAFVDNLESELELITQVRGLKDMSIQQQADLLAELRAYQDAFEELILLDSQGREQVYVARLRVVGQDELGERSQADAFLIPMNSGQSYYSPVRFDETSGDPLFTMAIPLINPRSGQSEGVLVAETRLKRIWDLIAAVPLGEGESVYILDAQGRVIAHPNVSVVRRQTRFALPGQAGLYTGLQGESAVLASDSIQLGQETLTIVAEKSWRQAFALSIRAAALMISLILLSLVAAIGLGWRSVRQLIQPIEALAATAQAITAGDLSKQAEVSRYDEVGTLAQAFNTMTEQLRQTLGGLEQRIAERTAALQRRTLQLEAASQVARNVAMVQDTRQLLDTMVQLVAEQFGFYQTSIFLADENREYVVMQAASSPAGQQLVARGYRLEIGRMGIVGRAAGSGELRVTGDVGRDAAYLAHPDFPLTRSEIALPLKTRESLIGVLDVQSTQDNAFDQEDATVLQTMADQLALAIENARLLAQSQQTLRELEKLYGQQVRETWQKQTTQQNIGYRYTPLGLEALPDASGLAGNNDQDQPAHPAETGQRQLITPIHLRGQKLGHIVLEQEKEQIVWAAEEIALVEEVSAQVGLALENARLLEETQRRAAIEQIINMVTARIRGAATVNAILQRAAEELGTTFGASRTSIRLEMPEGEARSAGSEDDALAKHAW